VVPEPDASPAPEALPVCEVPEDEPALTEPLAEVPVEAEALEVEPLAMPALDDPLDAPLTPETPPADEPAELPSKRPSRCHASWKRSAPCRRSRTANNHLLPEQGALGRAGGTAAHQVSDEPEREPQDVHHPGDIPCLA
jgi:hypothetical protein